MPNLSSTAFFLIAALLISAWLFQAYWGVHTFLDAKDDIQKGGKVSAWLYARFVTPITIGLIVVFATFELGALTWWKYCVMASSLLLWPAILIVIAIRTYELVNIWTSKTA
jgi:hypothetical protein